MDRRSRRRRVEQQVVDEWIEHEENYLEYDPKVKIRRYRRQWKRHEVLGFGLVCIEIIAIIFLVALGVKALGYIKEKNSYPEDRAFHSAQTFSWKILTEFFLTVSTNRLVKDCLFFSQPNVSVDLMAVQGSYSSQYHPKFMPHAVRCSFSNESEKWTWMSKFVFSLFLPLVCIACVLIFLLFEGSRRRKGVQFMLVLPSFLCFFIDLFETIPLGFHYGYIRSILLEDMHTALISGQPPFVVPPVWEETQIHSQCCGIMNFDTWTSAFSEQYPKSCCNYVAFNCSAIEFPTIEQIWTKPCFDVEYEKLVFFERWFFLLWVIKLCTEMAMFWAVSQLSREIQPPPHRKENSFCEWKNCKILSRGKMTICGVTTSKAVVISVQDFKPGAHRVVKTNMAHHITLTASIRHRIVGSVEVKCMANSTNPRDIFVDMVRGNRSGLFYIWIP